MVEKWNNMVCLTFQIAHSVYSVGNITKLLFTNFEVSPPLVFCVNNRHILVSHANNKT